MTSFWERAFLASLTGLSTGTTCRLEDVPAVAAKIADLALEEWSKRSVPLPPAGGPFGTSTGAAITDKTCQERLN